MRRDYCQNIRNVVFYALAALILFDVVGCMYVLEKWERQPYLFVRHSFALVRKDHKCRCWVEIDYMLAEDEIITGNYCHEDLDSLDCGVPYCAWIKAIMMGAEDGNDAINEAWSYDFIIRQWVLWVSMLVPQALFACCVFDIKIIVASGFINCRKSFSQAKTCDPEKSAWVSIPDLYHIHNSAYPRATIDGNVHVWHKGFDYCSNLEQGWLWAESRGFWLTFKFVAIV